MEELGRSSASEGAVFFMGGATALLFGMREEAIAAELKLDPEPRSAFEAIAKLKNDLDINVELASPVDFIPAPPDWREKSIFVAEHGQIRFIILICGRRRFLRSSAGMRRTWRTPGDLCDRGGSVARTFGDALK